MDTDFQRCLDHCRDSKSQYGRLFSNVPRKCSIRDDGSQAYFLAPTVNGYGNSLYSVDIGSDQGAGQTWQKVLTAERRRQLTRSEQLLRERMRASGYGITEYDYIKGFDSNLVNTGSGCTLIPCQPNDTDKIIEFPDKDGSILHTLCPGDKNVVACVQDGDIWLTTAYKEHPIRITNTKASRRKTKITAGQSSFVLQEEFDRYIGYWWDPSCGRDGVYRILYEEVDESEVKVLHTFNPSRQNIENYSYPRPGAKNSKSVLKLLQITQLNTDEKPNIEEFVLAPEMAEYIGRFEYITRVGWTDDGKNFWVQLLIREQKMSILLLISPEVFVKPDEAKPIPCPVLLWREQSNNWINIKHTSCFEFMKLPTPSDPSMRLVTITEAANYPHLILLEGNLPPVSTVTAPLEPLPPLLTVKEVTSGEWCVLEGKVWVDSAQEIVYFEGNKASCLERHLYAVDLNGPLPCPDPYQLTSAGYYHNISLNQGKQLYVTSYSSQTTPPGVGVYSFTCKPFQVNELFHICSPPNPLEFIPNFLGPTNFTTTASSGETLHGIIHRPSILEEGKKYPTILYVYGGPEFQIVKNEFSRFLMKTCQWVSAGFAVVMLDNRGSSNRGKKFESHIQDHMGHVELEDQVAGLQAAAQIAPFIDLTRVAITGWSYGGYMALIGIAKRPDVFKVAISGAPVTDMSWYDTGYTERYLGMPPAESYNKSSVLSLAPHFPSSPGRLLIIHGMSDENVLYTHTSLLIDALVANGKPYQLQLFNNERHGIRSFTASNHCDGTILNFLLRHL